ncbi:MAG: hypothetical protein U0176_11360 [Bacteroidia bacterium]
MSRKLLLYPLLLLSAWSIQAQNLITNPGFESRSLCPSSISQFAGYVNNWTQPSTGSTDYSGCGFIGNGVIMFGPYTGTSAIGTWGGPSHPGCAAGSAYVEPAAVALTTPMVNGQNYTASFAVRIDGAGTASANPSGCMNVGMYFYHSSSPPVFPGYCCANVTPQFSVSGASVLRGPYTVFSGTFTATGNFTHVVVGAFCNATTPSCTNYNGTRMYFNIDDVSIVPSVILPSTMLKLHGSAQPTFNTLTWELDEADHYTQYRLERSTDAELFRTIDTRGVTGTAKYHYNDTQLDAEEIYYRLAAEDANGNWVYSEVIRLNTSDVTTENHRLHLTESVANATLTLKIARIPQGMYTLEVMDMQGRVVHSQGIEHMVGEETEISTSNFASAGYLLRLRSLADGTVRIAKWVH